jgi:flagellin
VRVLTNVDSMTAQRRMYQLRETQERENTRLSSGDRIYRAGLDPSGLAISAVQGSDSRSQQQALRNINDGISLVQVAEQTLASMHEMGARMKELSIAAASDTIGPRERLLLAQEFDVTKREYNRQKESSSFNGKPVLNGKTSNYEIQVGIRDQKSADRVEYDLKDILSRDFMLKSSTLDTKTQAQRTITETDSLIDEISRSRALLGSMANRMDAAFQALTISNENLQESRSKIRDTNIAESVATRAVADINQQATTKALVHANTNPNRIMKLLS